MPARGAIEIAGITVGPGQRGTVDLPLPQLYTRTPLTMPVHVVHGRRPGPCLFVSAAIHGDELNGVEIIRRVLERPALSRLRGTLLAVPIVNVYGVIHHSRYLPDRRDLNRSFPGSESGSLASRLAHVFMNEIVARCEYGIDLHTAAFHRCNLPQIRADLGDEGTAQLAHAFAAPVVLDSRVRDGSLREAAAERGVKMMLFEAGEALRFDEFSIRIGVQGVMGVMRALEMLPPARRAPRHEFEPIVARSSSWIRAAESGVLRTLAGLGARVCAGDLLAVVADPFGKAETRVLADFDGVIIGRTQLPLVHAGEALFHIARFTGNDAGTVADQIEALQSEQADADAPGTEPPLV